VSREEEEALWGWDPTPGVVSVWADASGRALVWRRLDAGQLVCEEERFRPWLLLSSLDFVAPLGARLVPVGTLGGAAEPRGAPPLPRGAPPLPRGAVRFSELEGPGQLRYRVDAEDGRALTAAVLAGARRKLGHALGRLRDLGAEHVLSLPPEEQYLVASGRTYFRGLVFDQLVRLTIDLETTGLDAQSDRLFLIALCRSDGCCETLEVDADGDGGEADLLRRLAARIREIDPDVIENHHLHGFDLPFLFERARRLRVSLELGRVPGVGLRPASRGAAAWVNGDGASARQRYTLPGREAIDTLDAVRRHDFSARDLPGHGLKAVARHFGIAAESREYVPGHAVHDVYRRDPERVRRYARDDVLEASRLARLLGGAAFALAQMVPRRYERLADAGPATGVIDPLLVRAYLRAGAALPAPPKGDGTQHTGAGLHLFSTGVAERVVKADVASLYPSLMRQYGIGPASDRLGALLGLIERLVDQRLDAKRRAKHLAPGSGERYALEALSAAMKIVVNSAYGYLGAVGLTRFSDVHAANEVTRRGRELLDFLCRELARRGVTLLEADTDGVYFSVPEGVDEAAERRIVSEIAALLPEHVQLEFDGRYAAMLSHEPKNYALLSHAGAVQLRGVAFRSSRLEAYGTAFLRDALGALLRGDVPAVRRAYVEAVLAVRRRALATADVTTRARLTKTPEQYLASRGQRRELTYEALLASGRRQWRVGDRVQVYRASGGRAALFARGVDAADADAAPAADARDYDAEYYVRQLSDTFASRLARAFTVDDFASIFADPKQPSLFETSLREVRPILTRLYEV
jgi:DNA polymerase elongation subunit (family B)